MDHPDFHTLVGQVWSEVVIRSPSFKVAEKLRRLKLKLKEWNLTVFGDIRVKIEQLYSQQSELEARLQTSWNLADDAALQRCSVELKQSLTWEP